MPMFSRWGLPSLATLTFTVVLLSSSAHAVEFAFDDANGLHSTRACLATEVNCLGAATDFNQAGQDAVTGSITWDEVSSIDVDMTVASFSLDGDFDGVSTILFTDVNFVVNDWFAMLFGGNQITALGSKLGTISGTYEQFDGSMTSVVGPSAFNLNVRFQNLVCIETASAICSYDVGTLRDFVLDFGATTPTAHEIIPSFTVSAPEPASAALLGLGIVALGAARPRRRL